MVDFNTPDLAAAVEMLQPAEIDALTFGAVRLDADNRVAFYSKAEAKLSGYGDRPVMGRVFFSEIAPCMEAEGFTGRINAARQRGTLDLHFGWIGDFTDRRREIEVRVQSAKAGGIWIFLKRGG